VLVLLKQRNDISFNNQSMITARRLLLLICSPVNYWLGNAKNHMQQLVKLLAFAEIPQQVLEPQMPLEQFQYKLDDQLGRGTMALSGM
jgi:hypothetical protein